MMYDGVRLAVFATIVAAALFDGTHATWNGSLDYKIQRVQTEHPTLDESREAAFEFFRGMAAVGYGQTAAVVFGAASIRHHFPDFRSTPDLDIIVYEPHDLRLNRMLEKMETNSAARLQWADDKESLFYIADSGRPVHIDVGYLDFGRTAGAAMSKSAAFAEIVSTPNAVPYATPEEMFIIKICASINRGTWAKERQDVADAEFIVEHLGLIDLVGDPIDLALNCLQRFVPKSMYDITWWEEKISMYRTRNCTMHDWFAFQSEGIIGEMVIGQNT